MRARPLAAAIAAAMFSVAIPAIAQEKIPDEGNLPSGPPEAPLGTSSLPGVTCVGAGGTNCPIAIPDLPQGGQARSFFEVPDCPGEVGIGDVNIGLDIAHTWVGDLRITVTSPNATDVVIVDRPGGVGNALGCSRDNIYAVLDDSAATSVENECANAVPTIDGTFIPNNPLGVLHDEPAGGQWGLFIEDLAGADVGTLNDWSVDVSCAIPRATFTVNKVWTDGNPGSVDVTLSCNTGLPLEQTHTISPGDGVEFVVVDFDDGEMDCEVTEVVPNGYSPEYFDGFTNSSTSCEYGEVGWGSEHACRIINSPDPVEVEIEKEWVFEGSSTPDSVDTTFELTLYCTAEIVDGTESCAIPLGVGEGPSGENGTWCKSFWGDGPEVFSADVIPAYPGSICWVEESVDAAVEVDNGCGQLEISAGNGASCTITNTVFFEGIPTLSRYGLAILALFTLGLGLIGFRRFS